MFFANRGSGYVKRINLDGTNSINWAQVNNAICYTVYNNSLYVNDYNNGIIYKIVVNSNGTAGAKTTFATVGIYCIGSVVANVNGIDYLFVTNNHGIVSKLSLTSDKSNDNLSWFNCGSDSYAMVVYNGFLYISNNGGGRIVQVNLSNPAIYNYTWAGSTQGVTYPVGLVLFDGYIYVSNNAGNQYVNKISLTNPGTNYVSNFITGVSQPSGIAVDSNNYLYILSTSGGTIYKMNNTLLDNINWSGIGYSSYGFFTFDGNYLYLPNIGTGSIFQINLDGSVNTSYLAGDMGVGGCIINNGYLYVTNNDRTNDAGNYIITRISISPVVKNQSWAIILTRRSRAIVTDGTYLYVSCYGNGSNSVVSRILISNPNTVINNWITGISYLQGLAILDGYLYIAADSLSGIYKVSLTNPSSYTQWATLPSPVYGLAIYDSYIYASSPSNYNIYKVSLTNPTSQSIFKTNSNGLNGIAYYNNYLYAFNGRTQYIARYYLPPTPPIIPPPPCFKKDTKILTDKGYIPVQYLRKGDLVKTLRNDYKAIHMIGKKLLTHDASQERNKEQLFVYRRDQYPEILEDLVLTGCHSILVDRFSSDQQREKTLKTNGDIYITDNKYRLPACVDEKAVIFEASGDYLIYHIALENEDYYMNYGIYANGILVETCSKRYLKEISGMKLL